MNDMDFQLFDEVNQALGAHIKARLEAQPVLSGAIDLATSFLISRISEVTQAAHALVTPNWCAPIGIIVLARVQFETYITLEYILKPNSETDRTALATKFIAFAEYEHIRTLGDDIAAHKATLSASDAAILDRRIEIANDVEVNFDARQKKQRHKTWNGISIREMIDAVGRPESKAWYSLMSQIVHPSLSMMHKSMTIGENYISLCQSDGGTKDSVEWIARMNRISFFALLRALLRHGSADILESDKVIAKSLGIENLPH